MRKALAVNNLVPFGLTELCSLNRAFIKVTKLIIVYVGCLNSVSKTDFKIICLQRHEISVFVTAKRAKKIKNISCRIRRLRI